MEQYLTDMIIAIVNYFSSVGPIVGILLIILESVIPLLPLSVFIAINVLSFGFLFGFIISYLSTVFGCVIAFILVRKVFKNKLNRIMKENSRAYKFMKKFSGLKFSSLVLIIALPFTPAFLINIWGGLSDISFKKFLVSVLIGKLAIVYFWGFIGNSLLESITNPGILLKIFILLGLAYVISKIVEKKFGIK